MRNNNFRSLSFVSSKQYFAKQFAIHFLHADKINIDKFYRLLTSLGNSSENCIKMGDDKI